MNLREEIKDIIKAIDMCQNFDDETYYREADNILSKVEKRIDSIKQYPATNGYQKAWNKGENRIKKEMKEMLKNG